MNAASCEAEFKEKLRMAQEILWDLVDSTKQEKDSNQKIWMMPISCFILHYMMNKVSTLPSSSKLRDVF